MNANTYEQDFNNKRNTVGYPNNVVLEAPSNNITALQVPQEPVYELKKKNRTLQFYKFLFYSMKVEIKVHEFYDLVRFSNQSEISLWILSIILYFNSPNDFSNIFVWIHLIHIVRGLIGFVILLKLPRSYAVVEAMKNVPEKEMETKLFNDIARDVVKREVVDKLEGIRCWLVLYFILTFVNFIFDVIDFLYVLASVDKVGTANNKKVILLASLIIDFLYLAIDLAYIFWTSSLRYTFPPAYMTLLNQSITGFMDVVKRQLKFGKKATDIKQEAAVQKGNPNLGNAENAVGMSVSNVNNPDHIEIDIEGQSKMNSNHGNDVNHVNHVNNADYKAPNNEEQLDR